MGNVLVFVNPYLKGIRLNSMNCVQTNINSVLTDTLFAEKKYSSNFFEYAHLKASKCKSDVNWIGNNSRRCSPDTEADQCRGRAVGDRRSKINMHLSRISIYCDVLQQVKHVHVVHKLKSTQCEDLKYLER